MGTQPTQGDHLWVKATSERFICFAEIDLATGRQQRLRSFDRHPPAAHAAPGSGEEGWRSYDLRSKEQEFLEKAFKDLTGGTSMHVFDTYGQSAKLFEDRTPVHPLVASWMQAEYRQGGARKVWNLVPGGGGGWFNFSPERWIYRWCWHGSLTFRLLGTPVLKVGRSGETPNYGEREAVQIPQPTLEDFNELHIREDGRRMFHLERPWNAPIRLHWLDVSRIWGNRPDPLPTPAMVREAHRFDPEERAKNPRVEDSQRILRLLGIYP
jgi:hypothetical protein